MRLTQFNLGKAARLDPHLISPGEGVLFDNIDISKGSLTPIRNAVATAIKVDKYSYYYIEKDEWVSSSIYRDYIEYQRVLYYSEAASYPKKYNGVRTDRLGIAAPTTAVTISNSIDQPSAPTDVTLTQVTTGGNFPAQNDVGVQKPYNYLIVNVNTEGLVSEAFEKQLVLTGSLLTNKIVLSAVVDGGTYDTYIYRYYGGAYRYVGIINATSPTFDDNDVGIYKNDKYDVDLALKVNGTYQYVLTYYNSSDGSESMPSPLSEEEFVTKGYLDLTDIPISGDTQVDKKRLYRIGGTLTDFTLVVELSKNETTYRDKLADVELLGDILVSTYNAPAPANLQYLVESYGVFFGAVEDKLYYSIAGFPNAWPTTQYIDFEKPITGIGIIANGVIVFTEDRSWIISGTSSNTFIKYPLGGDQGCISHQSIQKLSGSIIWMSKDGICTTDGSEVKILSQDKLGQIELTVENAVVHNSVYYVQQTSGKILALDIRFGPRYIDLDFGVTRLVKAGNILYGYFDGTLYKALSGSDYSTMTYHSPVFTEGAFSNRKTYKSFYLRSSGTLSIDILIDGELVHSETVTTKDTHELIIPQDKQNGYSVQFYITGTGIVYELEWAVMGRQNGR